MNVMNEELIAERRNGVLEVTLNRPKANAIDAPTSRKLGDIFAQFRDDDSLRAAVITARGRFFCAGWDLKAAAAGEAADADFGVGGFGGLQELPRLHKPVLAAVNGIAFGGGFELALSADMIIASPEAVFALPEIKAGTLADAATVKLPRRIPHHIAMELLLTGRRMDVGEAKHWGLVNEIVPARELTARAREIAALLAAGPPLVFAAIKEVIAECQTLSFQEAMDKITGRQLASVDKLYSSEDQKEGARAFAEKRDPIWRGR